MKVAVIDNYDSFTYNLVDLLYKFNISPIIFKNNDENIELDDYSHIIISPGPSHPLNSGLSIPLIKKYYKYKKILGVCLGHQAIGEVFNCKTVNSNEIMHGKVSDIHHNGKRIFNGLPSPFKAVRYHSLVINKKDCMDSELNISAYTEREGKFDNIMAVSHKVYDVFGVQFHPESFLSEYGDGIIKNFLSL
jgi:anthranilate synthase component 2